MMMTRRDMAVLGTLAFGASGLLSDTAAAADDAAAVAEAVEAYRKAILAQDKAQLEKLAAEQLSYGHSSAVVQTKAEFVNGVMTRKATLKLLEFPDVKVVGIAGNAAIVRHTWHSESELNGKPQSIRLGVLMVWQKQDDDWKLLARQGYKLPG
jgi:ketosteroid isomerase-like protein